MIPDDYICVNPTVDSHGVWQPHQELYVLSSCPYASILPQSRYRRHTMRFIYLDSGRHTCDKGGNPHRQAKSTSQAQSVSQVLFCPGHIHRQRESTLMKSHLGSTCRQKDIPKTSQSDRCSMHLEFLNIPELDNSRYMASLWFWNPCYPTWNQISIGMDP